MSKELRTSVAVNTSSAVASLKKLENQIRNVQNAIDKSASNSLKLDAAINRATNTAVRLNKANESAAKSADNIGKAYKRSGSAMDMLITKVKRLAGAYLGVMGAKAAISTSDTLTSAENRLNALNGGNSEATAMAMDKMYASSQRVRMGYSDMIANVSKSMTLANGAFGGNIDNAIRFQEIMSEAYTLGGASAAEMSSSMYQMIQALGSGTLQGDELRSVREGAPVAYKEIEKFAQGVYNTTESLKDMASEGLITSEIVVSAMMNAGDAIDEAFGKTQRTFAQTWTNIKNIAVEAFQPMLNKLSEILNSDIGQSIVNGIGEVLMFVSNAVSHLFQLVVGIFEYISNNWKIIQIVLKTAGVMLTAYLIPKMVLLGSTINAALSKAIYLATTTIVEFFQMAKALGFATAMSITFGVSLSTWAWIALGVLGLLVGAVFLFTDSLSEAIGVITGSVLTALTFVLDSVIGVINSILQVVYAVITPILDVVEFILNACNGGFTSFGGMVANLIGNIISWFVGLGKVVTTIIDAIFGTDWTRGLESLQATLRSWGKSENAITLNRNAPQFTRINYSDAFGLGYNLFNGGSSVASLPDSAMPDFKLETSDLNPTLKDISGDTKSISKSMALTAEDLEYIRKVADMEWKKEYTTAEIKVDMSNYNTVNGDSDIDGIVTKLTDKLYEELSYVANGVYE